MLFVNFLCLLYLMLLVNGLTVSKNIDNKYFDERVDSIHDFEYTTPHKSKHDKFLHKHRRIKSGITTPASKVTIRVTTNEAKSTKATTRTQYLKLHKSTKRRLGGFWRKFKIKEDKALIPQLPNTKYKYERASYGDEYKKNDKRLANKRRKNMYRCSFKQKKREATYRVPKKNNKLKEDKGLKNVQINITPYENVSNTAKVPTYLKTVSHDEELKEMLTTMTTKVTELKRLYGLEKHKLSYTSHKMYTQYTTKHTTTETTTESFDIPGTAQLEALLNDIKEKALHLIVEQNPAITDLITNMATEATFEADPLLTHLEVNSPAYSLYTFITLNSDYGKRDAGITKPDDEKSAVNIKIHSNCNREGRSVAEDAMTAAQSVEDILQKEIKNIYNKVKNKVSRDFRKEIDKVKTTIKPQSKKKCSKDVSAKQPTPTKTVTETSKKSKSTMQLLQNRVDRKSGKNTKVTDQEITTPTADDYALLTLYEQMLSKSDQNNIMNILTSQEKNIRKKRHKQLTSNRNFKTLLKQNLNEDIKKLDDDREEVPDELEYNFEPNLPEISKVESATESDYSHTTDNTTETRNEIDENIGTEITPYDNNSYESLTSKISYNEYVNGYKHYLNFQKEQANEKFSDLVKYQAHRHHSIDDIGKYILNKIPQLPPRDKRFFEYEYDHDLSTKSEESWFKKHFYMFIDNGIPKKYHTSQTISLKSATPDIYDTSVHSTETLERNEFPDKLKMSSEAEDNNVDINLEKLSQVLEENKASSSVLPVHEDPRENSDSNSKNTDKRHGHIIFKSFTPHIIDKVFGKDRKTRERADVKSYNHNFNDNLPAEYSNYEKIKDINFLFSNELDRKKRNTKYHKVDPITYAQKLMPQTKNNATLINVKKTKKKTDNAKLGCVDINVVVPPTAIVKLKGTKRKEGKLKNLLQKLHLSKCDKPKIKREYGNTEYTRKERSNPFQKLKNIFKPTPKSKVLKADSHLSDYDIMSSHIDTFKPVKYDKVLNIEEMKKQIPNITSDLTARIAPKFANNHISWNPRTTEDGFTDLAVLLSTTLTSLSMTPVTILPQLVNDPYRYSTTKKSKMQDIEELFKVNIKTKSPYEPYKKSSFPQHMPLNDIKDQVDNMIIKINSDNKNKIYSMEAITNSNFLMNNNIPINRVLLQSNFSAFYTKNPKNNKYSKACLKIGPNSEKHTILDLKQNSEFVEDNSYLKTPERKFNDNKIITQPLITTAIPTRSLLFLSSSNDEEKGKYKPYPDYFSDLLMWNKDILNSDRVPTPWRDILKNVNHELEYSTRDMDDLQNELIKINDGLKPNLMSFKESSTPTYSHERILPRNWLQSMVLEKPPIGKSVFIEQEKKFVNFDPSLTDRHLKAADIINELNKFTKTFSDETKYNLDNIHNPLESSFENKDLSRILVDTTLLAYDDDVNYISTLTPRELSKNALNIARIGTNVAASLKAKSNQQPLQYFATPLPMKMTDFQEFLKDNKLDVESVTSPNVDLPTLNAYSSNKYRTKKQAKKITTSNTMKKQKSTKAKTTKLISTGVRSTRKILFPVMNDKDLDSQFNYLENLEWNTLNDCYNSEEKERFKRYSDLHYDSYFMNLNTDTKQSNKRNKEMNKRKITNKKPFTNIESDLKIKAIPETAENVTPKDFEITIINFGDINKFTNEYAPINSETTTENITEVSEKTFRNVEQTPLNVDFIENGSKDSEFLHKLHNDLFYDEAYAKSKETVTEPTETLKIQETTVPTTSLAFHEAVLKKMPINTNYEPKRVRISSQSYKYDIIYHHPEKIKKDHGHRNHTHFPSYVTTTEDTISEELFSIYNIFSFAGARESDVAGGDCGKSRIVRKIKTSSEDTLDHIGYTEEPRTTSILKTNSKKNPRHKLKKFFPVIHDKLNIFSKHSSPSNFLDKPSTIIVSRSSESWKGKLSKTMKSQKSDAEMACIKKELIEFLKKYSDDVTGKQLEKVVNKTTNEKFKTLKPVISLTTKANINETKNAYVELGINEKQAYVDMDSEESLTTKQTKTFNITNVENSKDYINKREIQDFETHTAKDVAALEVIIDMMKNPVKYHEDNQQSTSNGNNKLQNNDKVNAHTNSIQVHIAIPYENENSKKRSLAPVKVRKVFTAKLSTPVDIEYQVHSFEESPITKKPLEDMEGLSPGLYLIVDSTYFPQGVALSPMKIRQVKHTTEKLTSTVPSMNLAKVTLSKDFISAINKQLLLLCNITNIDKDKRDVTNDTKIYKNKRSINWNAVNNVFGHDRVCHCKCKVNKTLCKACAASDSVMSELIFELENLSKYMTDHCTEIQTYFWMNPSGGKRLKDSVHKIDQSLRDYYKRIRGKCQGRTCKTFATLIDKRDLHNNHESSKNAGLNFINDLEAVVKDIEKATKTATCFKENLQQEVKKMEDIINDCKLMKTMNKRSDFSYGQDKDSKNVYSLDKINVNIICNTESTLPIESITPHNYEKNVWIDTEYKYQKPKGFKGLFLSFLKKKKHKTLAEYLKQTNKSFHKREVKENQVESPLISDTGGSFWHDYIRKSSNQPIFARESKLKNEVQTKHDDIAVPNKHNTQKDYTERKLEDNILSSIESYTTNISNNNSSEGGELVSNINHFFKLVSNVDVRQVTEENSPPHKISTTIKNKSKKIKHKKQKCKIHKTINTKIHKKPNYNNETKIPNNITESQYKYNIKAPTTNLRGTMKSLLYTTKETTSEQSTVTKKNLFKMITTDFFKNVRNARIPLENASFIRMHNFSTTSSECLAKYNNTSIKNCQSDENVISDTTTEINPNIIIIDDTDEPKSNRYKDLLLSIIDYESNKLNKEWVKFANFNLNTTETKQRIDHKTTKKLKTLSKSKNITTKYDTPHDLMPLLSKKSNETKTSISVSALLDNIVKKFKIKIVNNEAQIKTDLSKKALTNGKKTQSSATSDNTEADDLIAEPCICNIKATRQHILNIRNEMPIKDFEKYITNITCQKYEQAPNAIFLEKTRNKDNRNTKKWSWIRDRRSTFRTKSNPKVDTERLLSLLSPEFEVFYRNKYGIYKEIIRKKRSANFMTDLNNLPKLHDSKYKVYALAGDMINISCSDDSKKPKDLSSDQWVWKTERDSMLHYTNVVVDGDVVNIVGVQPKNDGQYICKKHGLIKRNIKLAILKLPNLIWLSTLLYSKDTECTHDDLTKLKSLGPEISKKVFQRQCSVKIYDPVCLDDKVDGKTKVRGMWKVDCRGPAIDCSVSCRRDLQTTFASISAENIPALGSIEVVLLQNGVNSTWTPSKYHRKSVVTIYLRDFTNHKDQKYGTELSPGSLHLVVSCPAGYRLLSHLILCAPCPINTYSRKGDNACLVCPRGSHSTPGADSCRRAITTSRRYDWWICPPCGYSVAVMVTLCCCGVCVALTLLVQMMSRCCCGATKHYNPKDSSELPEKMKCRKDPGPTRSSRVILSRFFKPSLTSSMATDSQETKFDMWKARNLAPPLPPIDFDS